MFHVRALRVVQRVVVLTAVTCLFGSIFIWYRLYTEFGGKKPTWVDEARTVKDDFPVESSRIERLESDINILHGVERKLRLVKHEYQDDIDLQASVIVRNVFDIRPVTRRQHELPVSEDRKKDKEIIQIGIESKESAVGKKYLFVLHHYEQLGKTTENFVQLCSIAAHGSRSVVQPFVRDSRMCGLQTGWWGESLTKSRLFRPLGLYFNVDMLNELLSQNGYSVMRPLVEFKEACSRTNLTLVHFLYSDGKETTKKWFSVDEKQYRKIYSQSEITGWTTCPVIDKGLNISQRLGGMKIGRQLCVNADKVLDHNIFENNILNGDQCAVIVYWKGFGTNRTHFKPKVKLTAREIVHKIRHSNVVEQEADLFRRVFLEKRYIAVHVRSERQILWYSLDAFLKCAKLLVVIVKKLKQKHRIDTVFLASDLTQYGSDTLAPGNSESLQHLEKYLLDGLSPRTYGPHRKDPMLMDHGVIAMVEMNILSYSDHLVTVGSGSFQEWLMALFMERKKDSRQDWTITRVCSKEKKIH